MPNTGNTGSNQGLLERQWRGYAQAHHNRANLLIHLLTVPIFMAGSLALPLAWIRLWIGLAGCGAMLSAVALQGRGHRRERSAPAPFAGPVDVLQRLFAEQWITFPRFVFSGCFFRAWQ